MCAQFMVCRIITAQDLFGLSTLGSAKVINAICITDAEDASQLEDLCSEA